MRTDVHTHAFHPKIAHKAVAHLNDYYDVQCSGLGTIEHLQEEKKKACIDRCVVLCAATAPAQVIPANNYAIEVQKKYEHILCFGTIHPGYEAWQKELQRLKNNGIQGLKLHPDFQSFWMDDPRLLPIIEEAKKDFIFQFHIGDAKAPANNPSCPYKMAKLVDTFPDMRLIAAHLGGYRHWQHAYHALVGRDIWIETSSSTKYIEERLLQEIFQKHDGEKILFGSDYPLYSPAEEMQRLQAKAGMSSTQLDYLLNNADKLLTPKVWSKE